MNITNTSQCARINDTNGTIMLCRASHISIFTLNGDPILSQNICVEGEDLISSCAFYEGNGNEYLERDLIFTGHKRGVVNVSFMSSLCSPNPPPNQYRPKQIWNKTIRAGAFVLEHVKRMNHLDQAGFNIAGAMTAVLPMAQVVYTGDEDGRVVSILGTLALV